MRTTNRGRKLTVVIESDFWIFLLKMRESSADLGILFWSGWLELGAVWTEFADESLADDELECWREEERFDLHIHESGERV